MWCSSIFQIRLTNMFTFTITKVKNGFSFFFLQHVKECRADDKSISPPCGWKCYFTDPKIPEVFWKCLKIWQIHNLRWIEQNGQMMNRNLYMWAADSAGWDSCGKILKNAAAWLTTESSVWSGSPRRGAGIHPWSSNSRTNDRQRRFRLRRSQCEASSIDTPTGVAMFASATGGSLLIWWGATPSP